HLLGEDDFRDTSVHFVDYAAQRGVAPSARQAWLHADRRDRRRRDHLRASRLARLADLVHVLRVRRRALRPIARRRRAAPAAFSETLALFLVAFALELLGFVHACGLRTARATGPVSGPTTTGRHERATAFACPPIQDASHGRGCSAVLSS